MEHTNLFLFENQAAFEAVYPDDKVDTPIPGVAYVRASGDDEASTYYNRMVTNYSITIHSKNKSGETVAQDYSIQTPRVLDGNDVKMNVVANPVEDYKPRYAVEKVEFTSASTEHTVIYLAATSYTVTVHHMFSGETLTADTEVLVDDIFEEDVVRVKIEPENIPGYKAEPAYISVSGDMEYTLEYEEAGCYVDLGLPSGTLWGCNNLGAENPEDLGTLFAWGELEGKSYYELSNYKFYEGGGPKEVETRECSTDLSKYTKCDGLKVLEAEDDAASVAFGGEWHMPTPEQVEELWNYTTLDPTHTQDGYVVLTSTVNGNSIVMPFTTINDNVPVFFWTNTMCPPSLEWNTGHYAYLALYDSGDVDGLTSDMWEKYSGFPVRPVQGDGPQPGPEDVAI